MMTEMLGKNEEKSLINNRWLVMGHFCKLKNNSIIGYIIRVDIFRRVVNKISNHLRKTNENLIQDCWKLILKLIIIKHTFRKNIKMVTKLQNEMESLSSNLSHCVCYLFKNKWFFLLYVLRENSLAFVFCFLLWVNIYNRITNTLIVC